jgi:GTP pyrophosphokinase
MYKKDKNINFSYVLECIKLYRIKVDLVLLRKAYRFLEKTKSEDQIKEYLEVFLILIEYNSDSDLLISSLIDFSQCDENFISTNFPENFLNIKKGMDNLDTILEKSENVNKQNLESLRKYLISSCLDIRVLVIRIAQRLLTLRNKDKFSKEFIYSYAKSSLDIYSPICEYLGLNSMKAEIDDLSFHIISPNEYNAIADILFKDNDSIEIYSKKLEKYLYRKLSELGIKSKVFGRRKTVYSIYKKIIKIKGYFDPEYVLVLNDLLAFTILVDSIELCYKTLGIVHSLFPYISEEFDDYIVRPKKNGFRTLQTTVYALDDILVEIQIKTYQMHDYNEFGPASHILYKQGKIGKKDKSLSWMRDVSFSKGKNFNTITLFNDKIFVFTPQYMIKELRKGSNPIDFAYTIHTHVGNSMKGAKVNGKMVSLDYTLHSGDIVEIIIDKNTKIPKKDWINIAKQTSTKRSIRKFLKEYDIEDENSIKKNSEIFDKRKPLLKLNKSSNIDNIFNFNNIAVKLSKCCNPTVTDEIVGRVGSEGVIKVHKKNCSKLLKSQNSTFDFYWNNKL